MWAYYWPGDDVPQLTCTVDGKSMQVFDPPDTSSNPDISWQWYVCQAQGLSSQNHTVEITVTEATQSQAFCLDVFDVMMPQAAQILEQSGGNSTSTASTTSATSSSSAGVAAAKKTSTGAIVGGTLGGIILTLVICGALFFWYRRRKQHQYARMTGDDDGTFHLSPGVARNLRRFRLSPQTSTATASTLDGEARSCRRSGFALGVAGNRGKVRSLPSALCDPSRSCDGRHYRTVVGRGAAPRIRRATLAGEIRFRAA